MADPNELTPQEYDIVAEICDEAFERRAGHVWKRPLRYRQMPRGEFWNALREAILQQRFAHLREPKNERRAPEHG